MNKIFMIIAATMLLCTSGFSAVTWNYNNGVLTISGGSMPTYSTSRLPPWNTYKDSITSVVIEEGVTNIGDCAFYDYNQLVSVSIPSSVNRIREKAFQGCSRLSQVTIPAAVTDIYESAFEGCTALSTVLFEEGSQLGEIHDFAFKGTSPYQIIIPASVTTIHESAFENSRLRALYYEAGSELDAIEERAFNGCGILRDVHIPNTVQYIGTNAFWNTSIQDFYVSWDATELSNLELGSNIIHSMGFSPILHGPAGLRADYLASDLVLNHEFNRVEERPGIVAGGQCGADVFWTMDNSGNVEITGTGDMYEYSPVIHSPWFQNPNVKSVTIGAGITNISQCAFEQSGLQSVTFAPNSQLERIDKWAFSWCPQLSSVTIPASVTTIASDAFSNCMGLQTVEFEDGSQLETIGTWAFIMCYSLQSITIPSTVTHIGQWAFAMCRDLTDVYLPWSNPNSGITFGSDIFYASNSLTNLYIPENSLAYYQQSPYWGQYSGYLQELSSRRAPKAPWIIADDTASLQDADNYSYDEVMTGAIEVEITGYEYYTLTGVKLNDEPTKGGMMYIERAIMSDGSSKVRKIMNK